MAFHSILVYVLAPLILPRPLPDPAFSYMPRVLANLSTSQVDKEWIFMRFFSAFPTRQRAMPRFQGQVITLNYPLTSREELIPLDLSLYKMGISRLDPSCFADSPRVRVR